MLAVILPTAAAGPSPTLDASLAALKTYTIGGDFAACQQIIDEINAAKTDAAAQAAIAEKLASALHGASCDAQRFLCSQLYLVCTEKEAALIAPLLTDEKLSISALTALQQVKGREVDRALLNALGKTTGRVRTGIIDAIGARGDTAHVKDIAPLLKEKDVDTVRVAAGALGKIGGAAALDALNTALSKAGNRTRPVIANATLMAAERTAAAGDITRARAVMERLTGHTEDGHVRAAAMCDMAGLGDGYAASIITRGLKDTDPVVRMVILGLLRRAPEKDVTAAVVAALPELTPDRRAATLLALGDRGDAEAAGAALQCLSDPDPAVRLAALQAAGKTGGPEAVKPLIERLAGKSETEADAAENALTALKGADVDAAVAGLLEGGAPALRARVLLVLGGRAAAPAVPTMLYYAEEDEYLVVRQAAFKALGMTVSPKEFPQLVDALADAPDECREPAEAGTVAALRRLGTDAGGASLVATRYAHAFKKKVRVSLVHVLGASGDPAALKTLQRATHSWTKDVRKAAVDALCQWPTPDALETLRRIARRGRADVRDAAFDGVLRQLKRPSDRPASDTLAIYTDLFALAKKPEQIKVVLSGAGDVADRGALALISPYLAQETFKAEAGVAAEKVRRHFYTATTYDGSGEAKQMIDGDMNTRWRSGTNQAPGQWIQVDLGEKTRVSGVVLDTSRTASEYPRAWEIYVCDAPANPGKPVATGTSETPIAEAHFDAVEGRYVKVVQTATADCCWSVHELHILTN
jgi:HEAT repeat protein